MNPITITPADAVLLYRAFEAAAIEAGKSGEPYAPLYQRELGRLAHRLGRACADMAGAGIPADAIYAPDDWRLTLPALVDFGSADITAAMPRLRARIGELSARIDGMLDMPDSADTGQIEGRQHGAI